MTHNQTELNNDGSGPLLEEALTTFRRDINRMDPNDSWKQSLSYMNLRDGLQQTRNGSSGLDRKKLNEAKKIVKEHEWLEPVLELGQLNTDLQLHARGDLEEDPVTNGGFQKGLLALGEIASNPYSVLLDQLRNIYYLA